jgi:hypothetical protein
MTDIQEVACSQVVDQDDASCGMYGCPESSTPATTTLNLSGSRGVTLGPIDHVVASTLGGVLTAVAGE